MANLGVTAIPAGRKMSDKAMIPFAVPAVVFTALCLGLLAACDAGGDKDIAGVITTQGKWSPINEKESNIFYLEGRKPIISAIKFRLRNNTEFQELITFDTDSSRPSFLFATYLPYDTYYSLGTSEFLRDKSIIMERATDAFVGASLSQARDGENSNGKYLYVVGRYGGGVNCVMAHEGISLKFTATRTEMTYDAIVRFRYCSHKPVQEIIEIFDGIYLKR